MEDIMTFSEGRQQQPSQLNASLGLHMCRGKVNMGIVTSDRPFRGIVIVPRGEKDTYLFFIFVGVAWCFQTW